MKAPKIRKKAPKAKKRPRVSSSITQGLTAPKQRGLNANRY